ncbi:DEAD/DEAH box helicase [Lactovum miscens]|uniref:DEAD-box ATP-dependent RNA helicase CshB n=1 Tax=Lactovum miscens TaxID=190387 RepID=A0A841C7I5_9LACT|nr:DEAD/DEAH box helicase [Lactovum miscens]MBB5887698.1 ATP-dependent RNA helicase CshB [Lactovum miscens]
MNFTDFKFKSFINETLTQINFIHPTKTQEKLIPPILAGRDLIGEAVTGSGKTHAFLLPIMQHLDLTKAQAQAVIVAPSRELATQIFKAAQEFQKVEESITISNFVGGTDKKRQIDKLKNSQPMIVIGTPGRVLDMINSQALNVHTATTFVVDEADMTLDMGFLKEVDAIASSFARKLQMLVFSATIPQKLQPFLKKYLHNPIEEQIRSTVLVPENIENWLISANHKKDEMTFEFLKAANPYLALIFVNTKSRADQLQTFLVEKGLKVAKIHGDVEPRERKRTMERINKLEYQFVVATDLAARGIDIAGVSHVINVEIPNDLTFFIHRIGRTGRAGLSGITITLYEQTDDSKLRELEKMGLSFSPKAVKNNEIVDSYDRGRREKRKPVKAEMSLTTRGALAKGKKKIKPGYKRAIKWAVDEENKKKRRQDQNNRAKTKRNARKSSNKF